MAKKIVQDELKLRGFFRVQLTAPNKPDVIVGDSGWIENQITNEGRRMLVRLLGGISGSSQITHAALGTGTAPGAAATSLDGELGENVRATVSAQTNGSTSVSFTGTFNSTANFVTASRNISNIGLFCTSTGGAGTIFAGNTYTSSACATNQNVNFTYTITD